jgi:uncharacterized protein YhaN
MNKKSKKDNCYTDMIERFKTMQQRLDDLQRSVEGLLERHEIDKELSEGCPDEIAADDAAHKMIGNICLDALFDVEPKGDA